MSRLGRISYQPVVYCGLCAESAYLDADDAAALGSVAKLAKQGGWRHTKTRGWLCPRCVNAAPAVSSLVVQTTRPGQRRNRPTDV